MQTYADTPELAFGDLFDKVRAAGLLERKSTDYSLKITITLLAYAAGWIAFTRIGNSWLVVLPAAFLGIMFTQLGFVGHDAGHQQIFRSRRANRYLGLIVGNTLTGLCYGWWVPKHSAHHAHPNEIGRDPDVADYPACAPPAAAETTLSTRIGQFLRRRQAPLFAPLMLLRSVGLHISGAAYLLDRRDRKAAGEGLLIALHACLYLTVLNLVLSPVKAMVFVVIQQAVFSVYLGVSFAPNHKGMPIIARGSELGFAQRQIITARNVSGGRVATLLLGGLNYQIEHHLFPSMSRPNLKRAQALVKDFCEAQQLSYCETSFTESFRRIIRHLELTSAPNLTFTP
ncbi:MAG: fatty acid desaturase family protein [Acidimicrobiales bacterium]